MNKLMDTNTSNSETGHLYLDEVTGLKERLRGPNPKLFGSGIWF